MVMLANLLLSEPACVFAICSCNCFVAAFPALSFGIMKPTDMSSCGKVSLRRLSKYSGQNRARGVRMRTVSRFLMGSLEVVMLLR